MLGAAGLGLAGLIAAVILLGPWNRPDFGPLRGVWQKIKGMGATEIIIVVGRHKARVMIGPIFHHVFRVKRLRKKGRVYTITVSRDYPREDLTFSFTETGPDTLTYEGQTSTVVFKRVTGAAARQYKLTP